MRWIVGDTTPHIDTGASKFKHTYLVYLNDSEGEFIVDGVSYPIAANTAHVFSEGLEHKTQGTGSVPRLLLGPMNEFAEPVGATITYYSNYADAIAQTNMIAAQGITWIINDPAQINIIDPIYNSFTLWRVADAGGASIPSGVYANGFDFSTIGITGVSLIIYPAPPPCFLEGTKILCRVGGVETYIPIETMRAGTLVKTSRDGYKKVEYIGKGLMQNPGHNERTEQRLYKCSPANYPGLTEPIYLTGCHSILVDHITDEQREKLIEQMERIFVTDKKYRLTAFVDERAEPWASEGKYTIWHFALENENKKMNYGVYASGLLVETCCIDRLKNHSGLEMI
jgi:hypothetical protein